MLTWLLGRSSDLGIVEPWNPVVADHHAAATERMLLGACGPARIVGNRADEAIRADREARAARMGPARIERRRERRLWVVGGKIAERSTSTYPSRWSARPLPSLCPPLPCVSVLHHAAPTE